MKSMLVLPWSMDELSVLDAAASLAQSFGARVVGAEPPPVRSVALEWAEVGMAAPVGVPFVSDDEEVKRLEQLKSAFFARMREAGIEQSEGGGKVPSCGWVGRAGDLPGALGEVGRTFDLLVLPQPGALPRMPESIFESALFDSGRPILLVPPGRTGHVGRKIVIAWNSSTESARGVALAMPFLKRADAIECLSIEGATVPGPTVEDLAESLRLHGLPVTARHMPAGSRHASVALVEEARAFGADMIVKGAYTQSRLRQLIFGGVTRYLITSSPVPVMFSH
jgi:nucleotide-binding universal stress UspA family protein